MRSLRTRLLLSASLVLVVFLGFTSYLLDRAFRESAMNAVEDRLRGRIFMLIGAADFDQSDANTIVKSVPDPALSIPAAGHYARILSAGSEVLWSSRSMLGIEVPSPAPDNPGHWRLEASHSDAGERLFALTYGIIWEGDGEREPREFVLQAFENEALYLASVTQFRRSLWLWFAGLSMALLIVQALNLNRGLRPLSTVGEEVRAVEQGQREQIDGQYPRELSSLTRNINRLLNHNRESLKRYRHSLGDLAHSIKTPLAVLRNELDSGDSLASNDVVRDQIERIDRTVQYYLQRSAAAGRSALGPPLLLAPLVDRVVSTLAKVHAERRLSIEAIIPAELKIVADEGDLMEIIGNLADNACKWARHRVEISAALSPRARTNEEWLVITVDDDGPGIPADQIENLMQRGARLDESVEGHGIGLAIVRELVEHAYAGRFTLDSTSKGTKAHVELRLN